IGGVHRRLQHGGPMLQHCTRLLHKVKLIARSHYQQENNSEIPVQLVWSWAVYGRWALGDPAAPAVQPTGRPSHVRIGGTCCPIPLQSMTSRYGSGACVEASPVPTRRWPVTAATRLASKFDAPTGC